MVFLVQSWLYLVATSFRGPSQVYRLLGTKVDLTVSPREIQVLPSRVDTICCELKQILHQPRWFQIDLPPSVLAAWSESTEIEPQRDINKIEAVLSGYTSSTTMALLLALSRVAQRNSSLSRCC